MTETTPPPQVSRKTLIAVLIVFVGPLAVAIALFAFRDTLPIPAARTMGELIDPAVPLPAIHPRALSTAPLPEPLFRGHWTLAYLSGGGCDLRCEANLFKIRQVRQSVGRDMGRVERLLLVAAPEDPMALAAILERYPGLPAGALDSSDQQALERALGPESRDRIFIVDPLGNAMMRYPVDAPSSALLKDLKRLLKVSQIG